jgi:hypothetical protein
MNDTELDQMLNSWEAPEPPPSMRAQLLSKFPAKPPVRILGLRPRWIVGFAAAGALAVGASLIQDGMIMSDSGAWDAATHVHRTRIVHPFIAKFGWVYKGGLTTGWQWREGKLTGSVYMLDKSTRTHYGYTWTAEPLDGGQYRFAVLPLDPSVVREEGPIAPLARPGVPIIVGPGSKFEVDFYISGNERVYDRYELSRKPLPLPKGDDPALLTLTNPQLYINGVLVLNSGGVGEASGNRVSVQLRGRGEYSLTLDPRGDTRFVLAGTVKGNTIEFHNAGDTFRIVCTAPVARSENPGVYLYVRNDPTLDSSGFGGGGGPAPLPGPSK